MMNGWAPDDLGLLFNTAAADPDRNAFADQIDFCKFLELLGNGGVYIRKR